MTKQRFLTTLLLASIVLVGVAQSPGGRRFKQIARQMPTEWYASAEAMAAADSVLKYQFPSGGWAKNQDWHQQPEGQKLVERQEIWQAIHSDKPIGSTIDNDATFAEMMLLAKVYGATKKKKYREGFLRGLDYLLTMQYDNGGWPQFYPSRPPASDGKPYYSDHITFNDNAMANVMFVLRDIHENKPPYDQLKLSDKQREQAKAAFDKGIECILNTQIKKDGKLTVWCQQHDEVTLLPAKARKYELPSFTGCGETTTLLNLLMDQPNPDERIVRAVSSAIEWLKAHAISDMAMESFTNKDGKRDRRLVHRFGAPLIWARYYDLDTEEPFVCDRDGIKQPALEYIGYERRNGYGWYSTDTEKAINRYEKWIKAIKSGSRP